MHCRQHCLDIGCGLGLTAMVGQWLGAKMTAMDYEEAALHFAARNADINEVPQPLWTVMDWRRPAVRAQSMHRIWGGDIMYEKRFVAPVLRFLDHALAPGGAAWVAEPGRTVYDAFLHALQNGRLARQTGVSRNSGSPLRPARARYRTRLGNQPPGLSSGRSSTTAISPHGPYGKYHGKPGALRRFFG